MNSVPYLDFSQRLHSQSLSENRFIKAQYEITYACNLKCVHCYTDPYNKLELIRNELTFEDAVKVLDKLHEENIFWLCFTGGEIFMRKDFLKIYDYAHGKGFLITLFTNATLVTEEVADHLNEKRPFCIEVSIYGGTPEVYEAVTQVRGSFRRFQAGVERLAARQLPLKFKTSLMSLNLQDRELMKDFAESYGAPFNMSSLIYPRLDGDLEPTRYRLSAREILNLTVESIDEEKCSEIPNAETVKHPELYRCGCGKLNAHIDPYGKVGTCTWARRERFDFRASGIQTGMSGISAAIRSESYHGDSPCVSCSAISFCNKSPEMAVFETGDVEKPVDHFCEVAFGLLDFIQNRSSKPMEK